ncbi:DotU family type IV/VI secretion system protein [Donghicola eburneus]|uniref:DotU family type IV/VI secretion system protein n=1 Tax=Donghicola eburneus TaxID=393278 RepID=UPI0008EAB160|nr:DotU family type IV/VI secretion system protein [Donghicola eburneus]MCI5038626.1 DotU family type IV/VI secretion system protein [Donghicola eburneus]SFQ71194.1 type IV / VI secretion system protein, DotU family [Donghicola eburneus]
MADTHAPTMTLTADGISGPETGALRYPVSLSPSVLQSIERTLRAGQETGTGLMQVSAELIGLCGTVRRMQDIHEPHLVRAEIARSIIDLKYRVVQLDYPPSVAENLCLIFAIVIDEFILTSDWGKESGWENLTLVADLFGFRDGGDRFYNIAERALMQPKALNEFLHLIYIFLKLGYRGRYTVGQEKERDRLIHRLERVIDHPDIEIAPTQFGRELRKTRALRQAMPFARKLYFAGLAVLLMVGFVVSARFAEERTAARTLDRFRAETGSGTTPVYVYSSDTKTTVVRND